jgi:hypothetical protein
MSQANSSTVETSYGKERVVSSVAELLQCVADPTVRTITIAQNLEGLPEIRLAPNTTLRGHISSPEPLTRSQAECC